MSLFPVRVTFSTYHHFSYPVPEKLLTITGNGNHYYKFGWGYFILLQKFTKTSSKSSKTQPPHPPKEISPHQKKQRKQKNTSPQGLVYQVRGVQVAIDIVEIALHRKDIRLREIHGDGCAWCTVNHPIHRLRFRPLTFILEELSHKAGRLI